MEAASESMRKFQQEQLASKSAKNWDNHYKRCKSKSFKIRYWLPNEFPELTEKPLVIFEAGCGTGSSILPLYERNKSLLFYACDFSRNAIELLKENCKNMGNSLKPFVCDLALDDLAKYIDAPVDFALFMFTLSANKAAIRNIRSIISNVSKVLKGGSEIVIRDYAPEDVTQKRFKETSLLSENLYMRQDGTLAFFLSLSDISDLFSGKEYKILSNKYVTRVTKNRKTGVSLKHVFVQARIKRLDIKI